MLGMPGMPEIAAEATPASALVTYQSNDDNLRSEDRIVLVGAVPLRKVAIAYAHRGGTAPTVGV